MRKILIKDAQRSLTSWKIFTREYHCNCHLCLTLAFMFYKHTILSYSEACIILSLVGDPFPIRLTPKIVNGMPFLKKKIFIGWSECVLEFILPCWLVIMIFLFLFIGLVTLCKLRRSNPNFLSNRAAHKIKETIIRVGELLLIFVVLPIHFILLKLSTNWLVIFCRYIFLHFIFNSIYNLCLPCLWIS